MTILTSPRTCLLLSWSLVAIAACPSHAGSALAAGSAAAPDRAALARLAPLDRAERVVRALEDAEAQGGLREAARSWLGAPAGSNAPAGGSNAPAPGDLVTAELDSLVRLQPEDARTDLLYARLGRVAYEARRAAHDSSGPPPFSARAFSDWVRALDRAIARQPADAALHYWKARLCGTIVPRHTEDSFQMEPLDRACAVGSARRAVELAPREERYRELLATRLFLDGKLDEAAEVMRPARNGHHPLARLIEDWRAFPVPPGAAPFDIDPGSRRDTVAARGLDYPAARVRCYSITGDAAAVAKFYRGIFPSFRLFPEGPPVGGVSSYTNLLAWKDGALAPVEDARQVGDPFAASGLRVRVTEFRGEEALARSHVYEPIGEVVCWIYLTDLRRASDR